MSRQTIGSRTQCFCTEIIGCCNGLLCTQFLDFDYALWNPFTRRYNKLPQAPKLEFDLLKNSKPFEGFGYDHLHDDYKVLRIFQIFYPDDFNRKNSIIRNQICVYSLRLNSWKYIEDYPYGDHNYEFQYNHNRGCFVNGASHWLAYPLILNENGFRVQGLEWSIVAFNFEVEKFSTIPHPNANRNGKSFQIDNLGGFLCISEEVCETCYVWVMKQYGVGESWIKLLSLDLHSFKLEYPIADPDRYVQPVAYYSKNGEKLLMKTNFNTLTWYNLKETTSNTIRFPIKMGSYNAYMCLESLVSPYNVDDKEIAAQIQ
ncbi:F-box protein CPR1-like [Pistacia vera]|uniref:F-box protein CPR1-like n=1 Tax=Pistacia vera TaxID=55513 RepID=UPI001263A856|nr:F-box protein CPR1-like [Pistacia vera]